MRALILISSVFCIIFKVDSRGMDVVFSWKQLSYNFNGVLYTKSSDFECNGDYVHFADELEDADKFFIQYNNVPIGFEVYGDVVFVTVPRRRHGIPSTLNYVKLSDPSPVLRPFPDAAGRSLVSVYRPRIDECGRLWIVDTGLLEVPGERKQIQPPAIVVYQLSTKKQILRYELKPTDLIDERTPAGLTSITVDVGASCEDTHAYITDLATNGLVVFSLKDKDSWRVEDDSFKLDEGAMNFTVADVTDSPFCRTCMEKEETAAHVILTCPGVAEYRAKHLGTPGSLPEAVGNIKGLLGFLVELGHVISWRDGLFSLALSAQDAAGCRTAFFHPLVSTQEFAIDTAALKASKHEDIKGQVKLLGTRGTLTQSGSHDHHNGVLFFGNVAQDGVLCWNTKRPLTPENVVLVAQDHEKLVYISDLKVKSDEVWVLVNQIPRFVYDTLDPTQNNFYILKARVQDLIQNTNCA